MFNLDSSRVHFFAVDFWFVSNSPLCFSKADVKKVIILFSINNTTSSEPFIPILQSLNQMLGQRYVASMSVVYSGLTWYTFSLKHKLKKFIP